MEIHPVSVTLIRDVSGVVRLFYILSKNKNFAFLPKKFVIFRQYYHILNEYLVNFMLNSIFRQNQE